MATHTRTPATLDDLSRVEGKAELIDGEFVPFMASGVLPSRVALRIAFRLDAHAEVMGAGVAFGDGIGYALDPPLRSNDRQSFFPDTSYYVRPQPANLMRFVEGTPTFAVEVRSENDYGPSAEREMAAKRADYFESRTLVVWGVDPMAKTVAVYHGDASDTSEIFKFGEIAEAEPAVPGWRCPVDDLFH
jgi:Uma2 family endonuclease